MPQIPGGCSPQSPASFLQKRMGAQPGIRVEADPWGLGVGRDAGLLVPIEIASEEG